MQFKNIVTTVLLSIFTQFTFGQFESVEVIPENPTSNDIITVEYSAILSYSSCSLVDSSINVQGNVIVATLKYAMGAAAASCSRKDTLLIGYLNKGNYTLITNTTDTREYPYDPDTTYFTVGSVGVDEVMKKQTVEISPNPATDLINIEFELNNPENISLTVYDLQGKIIATPTIGEKAQGKHKVTISTTHLPKGIYLVQMNVGNEVITKKIVKL